MQELLPFVTKFLVLESNATFTGHPKPLYFRANKHRFNFAGNKLLHFYFPSRTLLPDEDPFDNENLQRSAMDKALLLAGIEDGDLLITADTDEIPSAHTIRLLQNCDGFPARMHLQLRNYIYSYEFLVDSNSWRSSVEIFEKKTTSYSHKRKVDLLLADAGWHCSFCFRYISDFVFKMQAYSHADRVRDPSFLNPERIQDIICKGGDLFDMLPEEYSFKDLIGKMGSVPQSFSGVHLPTHILRYPDYYKFLLPGNCPREPDPDPIPISEVWSCKFMFKLLADWCTTRGFYINHSKKLLPWGSWRRLFVKDNWAPRLFNLVLAHFSNAVFCPLMDHPTWAELSAWLIPEDGSQISAEIGVWWDYVYTEKAQRVCVSLRWWSGTSQS